MRRHARGFIEHQKRSVLKHDVEFNRFRGKGGLLRIGRSGNLNPLTALEPGLGPGGDAIRRHPSRFQPILQARTRKLRNQARENEVNP